MTIWLDLIATPNDRLGVLDQHYNTVTPEMVEQAVQYISEKYDSKV